MHTERKNIIKSTYTVVFLIVFLFLPIAVTFGAAVQNTNPTGDQSPTLSGNVEVGEVVWVNNVLQVRTRAAGTGTVRSVQLTTGTSNTGIVVNSSGNVGVGTVNPNYKLDVTGTIRTSSGGAISYGAGENYLIWNDDPEYSIVDDATDANYKTMKTFVASKSGSFKFKFSAYIQSGTFYWAWRVLKNGATVVSSGHYNSGLDVGEITSVHAYRRFVGTASDIEAGDSFALQMVSSDASGNPASGNGQILYAKEFRVYSTTPSVEHGGLSNVWGSRVGIGTITPAYKLDVTGDIRATGNVVAGGTMTANVGAGNVSAGTFGITAGKGNYTFEAAANTNNVLKIDATNERVGIGTGSPDSPLHIIGPSQVTNLHAVHTWDGGADAQTMVKLETTRTANGGTSPQIFFKDNYTGGYNWKIGGDDTGVDFSILKAPVGTFPNTYVMKFQGSTGNVGIGTISPSSILHISKDNYPEFRIQNTNVTNPSNFSIMAGAGYGDNKSFVIQDNTSGQARLVINNTGNVGIGTTSPSYKLDVSGGMRVSSGAATAGTFISTADAQIGLSSSDSWAGIGFADSGAVDDYIWYNGGNGTFSIGGGGANVANKKLHVNGGMTVGSGYVATAVGTNSLVVEGNITAGGTITANVGAPNVSAGTFGTTAGKGNYTFEAAANTNNVLKIDATNERVGVGTASPGYKLDVAGEINVPANTWISGAGRTMVRDSYFGYSSGYRVTQFGADLTTRNIAIGVDPTSVAGGAFFGTGEIALPNSVEFIQKNSGGTDWIQNVLFLKNGNVGIGATDPGEALEIVRASGNDRITFYNGTRTASVGIDSGNQQLQIASNDAINFNVGGSYGEAMRITSTGNVGIGTTAPAEKLHVQVSSTGLTNDFGETAFVFEENDNTFMTLLTPTDKWSGISFNDGGMGGGAIMYDHGTGLGLGAGSMGFRTESGSVFDMVITSGGNVGIGTTTPAYKLHVNGSAKFESPIEVGSPTAVNHATTKSYVDSILGTGGSGTSTASFATMYVSGTSTLAATTGKVIIGGAGPSLKLDVIGQGQFTDTISATKYYDYNDPTYYIDPANTGTSLKFAGAVQSDGTGINYMNGQLAVGTTNPGTYRLYVAGTSWFNNQVTINGNLIMNASSSITMGGGNIGSIGKITVQTIDPLYEIDGKKYATYAPSIAGGVKEEYVGRGNLEKISNSQCSIFNQDSNTNDSIDTSLKTENCKLQNYAYIIDFNKVERGSDLWLWYQAVDFDRDNVQAFANAYNSLATIGYKIDGKKLIFFSTEPTEFSYRLVGNRHDWKEWPTYSKDQNEAPSFILKAK